MVSYVIISGPLLNYTFKKVYFVSDLFASKHRRYTLFISLSLYPLHREPKDAYGSRSFRFHSLQLISDFTAHRCEVARANAVDVIRRNGGFDLNVISGLIMTLFISLLKHRSM